jgi:hypothetical protein
MSVCSTSGGSVTSQRVRASICARSPTAFTLKSSPQCVHFQSFYCFARSPRGGRASFCSVTQESKSACRSPEGMMHLVAECNTLEFAQHKLRQSVEQPHQCGVRTPEYSARHTRTHQMPPSRAKDRGGCISHRRVSPSYVSGLSTLAGSLKHRFRASRLPIDNLLKPPPSPWFELECCNGCNAHLRRFQERETSGLL